MTYVFDVLQVNVSNYIQFTILELKSSQNGHCVSNGHQKMVFKIAQA